MKTKTRILNFVLTIILCSLALISSAHSRTTTESLNLLMIWTPPTENTDGSPLTDLAGYYICISVNAPIPDDLKFDDMGTACTVIATAAADVKEATASSPVTIDSIGTIYVRIAAYDTSDNVSDFSNQATLAYDVMPADGAQITIINIKIKKASK